MATSFRFYCVPRTLSALTCNHNLRTDRDNVSGKYTSVLPISLWKIWRQFLLPCWHCHMCVIFLLAADHFCWIVTLMLSLPRRTWLLYQNVCERYCHFRHWDGPILIRFYACDERCNMLLHTSAADCSGICDGCIDRGWTWALWFDWTIANHAWLCCCHPSVALLGANSLNRSLIPCRFFELLFLPEHCHYILMIGTETLGHWQ